MGITINYFTATHESGIAEAVRIAAEYGIDATELRWFASANLSDTHPELEEIGSSDVSIHLSHLGNWEPELLRTEAARIQERNALVKASAARTGRSEAETLKAMQALFAPLD